PDAARGGDPCRSIRRYRSGRAPAPVLERGLGDIHDALSLRFLVAGRTQVLVDYLQDLLHERLELTPGHRPDHAVARSILLTLELDPPPGGLGAEARGLCEPRPLAPS